MQAHSDWLVAQGLGAQVRGGMTTRVGGVSLPPFDSMNLRLLEDDPQAVQLNRQRLAVAIGATPVFLNQVHGHRAVRLTGADIDASASIHDADASHTTERGVACTVMVADCLPVLFSAPDGAGVAAAHAGWRGLAGGILEATALGLSQAVACPPSHLRAWLGASIGPQQFEVGEDVVQAFGMQAQQHFTKIAKPGKWLADLPGLARQRLASLGIVHVDGGQWCTVSNTSMFFSFRRERVTGRMAATICRV